MCDLDVEGNHNGRKRYGNGGAFGDLALESVQFLLCLRKADKTAVTLDEEHNLYTLTFSSETAGERTIDWELISSAEYRRLLELHKRVRDYDKPPFQISSNGSQISIADGKELLEHVMATGKKLLTVQRFKGLGEMNPDQLWQTTMDAEQRTLLQVRAEDTAGADEIFTILMGDAVEPRRQFIEENALDVKNLDI